jgi:hypothetical protein
MQATSTYYETEVYLDTYQTVPIQEPTAWETAEQKLKEIFRYRDLRWGESFLIRREIQSIRLKGDSTPSAIFHDYMLRHVGDVWKREIAVWKTRSKRDYHIDVTKMF